MRIKDISNEELVRRFETACFQITNYPSNKKYNEEFGKLEEELCKRLGCDLQQVRDKM